MKSSQIGNLNSPHALKIKRVTGRSPRSSKLVTSVVSKSPKGKKLNFSKNSNVFLQIGLINFSEDTMEYTNCVKRALKEAIEENELLRGYINKLTTTQEALIKQKEERTLAIEELASHFGRCQESHNDNLRSSTYKNRNKMKIKSTSCSPIKETFLRKKRKITK